MNVTWDGKVSQRVKFGDLDCGSMFRMEDYFRVYLKIHGTKKAAHEGVWNAVNIDNGEPFTMDNDRIIIPVVEAAEFIVKDELT